MVLVEVRGRQGRSHSPADWLGHAKIARLRRLALSLGQNYRRPVRPVLVEVTVPVLGRGIRRIAFGWLARWLPGCFGIQIRILEIGEG